MRLAGSAEFPLIVLPFFVYTILPMFATFVAIDLFNGEYSAGTMKITLTRPVSRFSVFTAKVTSVALFILGSLMFVMLVSMLAGFIFNPVSAAFMGLVRAAAAYLVSFLPVFVFALLVILLSNLVRSRGDGIFLISVHLPWFYHDGVYLFKVCQLLRHVAVHLVYALDLPVLEHPQASAADAAHGRTWHHVVPQPGIIYLIAEICKGMDPMPLNKTILHLECRLGPVVPRCSRLVSMIYMAIRTRWLGGQNPDKEGMPSADGGVPTPPAPPELQDGRSPAPLPISPDEAIDLYGDVALAALIASSWSSSC